MPLAPDIRAIVDTDDVLSSQRARQIRRIPYTQREDLLYDFENSQLATTASKRLTSIGIELVGGDLIIQKGIGIVRHWIHKMLSTELGAFAIYSDNYGFGLTQIIGTGIPNEVVEAAVPGFISSAVTHHPDIVRVENVKTNVIKGILYCSFSVVLIDENVIEETITWNLI